jgi:hypothetical protein
VYSDELDRLEPRDAAQAALDATRKTLAGY